MPRTGLSSEDVVAAAAALAMTELGEAVRDALQGKSGLGALDALLTALQAADGFQWSGDPGKTFDWMTRFIDGGLRAARPPPTTP